MDWRFGSAYAMLETVERTMSWFARHQGVVRVGWLAALLILAACNNGADGGGY